MCVEKRAQKEKNIAENLNEMQNLLNFVEHMPVMEFQDVYDWYLIC